MNNEQLDTLSKILKSNDLDYLAKEVSELMKFRDELCQYNGNLSIFEFGDIVIDSKNNVLSIVIGPFSIKRFNNPHTLSLNINKKSTNDLYLTASYSSEDEKYRVRYVNKSHLHKLDLELSRKEKKENDLETYCKKQCICDCSPQCSLWKYGKWKNIKNK